MRFQIGWCLFLSACFIPAAHALEQDGVILHDNDAVPERAHRKADQADQQEIRAKKSSKKAADVENEAWRASLNAEVKAEDPKAVSHAVIKNENAAEQHEVAAGSHKTAVKAHLANHDDNAARVAQAHSKIHQKAAAQNRELAGEYKNKLKDIDGSDQSKEED